MFIIALKFTLVFACPSGEKKKKNKLINCLHYKICQHDKANINAFLIENK